MINSRTFKQILTSVLDTWTCFGCLAKFKVNEYDSRTRPCEVAYQFGYGSPRDGDRLEFDLCENCIMKIESKLKLNPLIQAFRPLDGDPGQTWGTPRESESDADVSS